MTDSADTTPSRFSIWLKCALAGVCIAGSVPPWGWWPLAFIGFAILDRLLVDTTAKQRFRRMWMVGVWWLGPAMLWMLDLTPPGYLIAVLLFAAYYGIAAALTPPDHRRRWIFPGAFALAELARWYWPFGGVPLANVALSQVDSPIGQTARLFGPLFVVILVVVIGQALAAAIVERETTAPRVAASIVVAALAAAWLHPRADVTDLIDVAVVQGGGPTRTRASSDQQPVVLARHIEATRDISSPVDLVLWPENVVNPGRFLDIDDAAERVSGVARIVPFGEYVPLRGLIERFSSEIPSRDVIQGTEPAVLDTPVGEVGVAISWEAYFERRSRDAIENGAQLLVNPTNGSSYWLTQVHTQQVASNQLRAIENDRWLLMAAPTGLSAVIDANGDLIQRTDIGERAVLEATVEMRDGRTLASLVGFWPVLLYGVSAVVAGRVVRRDS